MTFTYISRATVEVLTGCHVCGHDLLPGAYVYTVEADGSVMRVCHVCEEGMQVQWRAEEEEMEETARLASEECEP
jgi:ribosomal protein L24E